MAILTNDWDIRIKCTAPWLNLTDKSLVGIWLGSTNNRAIWFKVGNTNRFELTITEDGINQIEINSSQILADPDGTLKWVRATFEPALNRVRFYQAYDDPPTWAQFGSDRVLTATGVFESNA
ncbi:unnamed protein product, partial [marine sediment metagenome]